MVFNYTPGCNWMLNDWFVQVLHFFSLNMCHQTFLCQKCPMVKPVSACWLEILKWLWRWFELEVALLQSPIYILPGQMNTCATWGSPTMSTHYAHCVDLLRHTHTYTQKCTRSQYCKSVDFTPVMTRFREENFLIFFHPFFYVLCKWIAMIVSNTPVQIIYLILRSVR